MKPKVFFQKAISITTPLIFFMSLSSTTAVGSPGDEGLQLSQSSDLDKSVLDILDQDGFFFAENSTQKCRLNLSKAEPQSVMTDLSIYFPPGPNPQASAASSVLVVPNLSQENLSRIFESKTDQLFFLGQQAYDTQITVKNRDGVRIISFAPRNEKASLKVFNSIARSMITMHGSKIMSFSKTHFQKKSLFGTEKTFEATCYVD